MSIESWIRASCRRFGFLFHETMPVEVKELNAAMRNSTDARDHRQLQVKLSRLQQSLKQHEDRSLELQVCMRRRKL